MLILQRLRKAIQEQNWFAVVLELFIVVFGIVLGFQFTEWNENRKELKEEQFILGSLHTEFSNNLLYLDRVMAEHQGIISLTREMLKHTGPEPGNITVEKFDALLFPIITELPTFHPADGEQKSLISSGKISLVQSPAIRAAIAAWPGKVERYRGREEEGRSDVMNITFPYIVEQMPLLTLDWNVGIVDVGPSKFPRDHKQLLSSFVFENHIENRWVMTAVILEEGVVLREALVEIVNLLEEELKTKGIETS